MQLQESGHGLWWRLIFYYLAFFLFGLLLKEMALGLLIGTVLHLLWHYRFQHKLAVWLWRDRSLIPPEGKGSWEVIFNGIYRLQQRQRARRRELANLVRRFREGAEALPDAAVVIRRDGSIIWCNKLAQQLLGFRWPDDAGQHIGNLIRAPVFIAYMKRADFREPLELPSPQNEDKLLECRIMPYTEDQAMLVVRDVTRLKSLEQMRKSFVANVSHELRTPLTVLKGYLEMIEEPPSEAMWRKTQKVMLEQTLRMDALVNQLMTLTRIEASPNIDTSKIVDIPAMLSMLEQEALTLSGDKGQRFSFVVDQGLKVRGDQEQLRSAISNLVYNAIRHSPAGTEIRVEWGRVGHQGRFAVTDNGEGIAPEHIARLTERFYRVDKARSRQTGGSGLGLAIVKHALSHHDAHLEIRSKVGEGSCFSFTLPERLLVQDAPSREIA
ncbi:two-component system sensor histidine kinase PhoR [Zobellella denitrificans]|jgi:two-component system, OmpR family, phosphate regulon sensor histidine kinase PhoR|uniref:Phosphate regulon sensor protein PhoR n=1 Tax=Zobellella denitrificans TaxID=347534 RepID=A0A231N3P0_9GAMM|nr:phosphate regulon sensor histidine kinase PhoR [Zobellella denitrificans]ATG73508.1 phosphate regulon sensor protein [Zobellella denitrificans]OXS17163.1 two-component system sensor histidine kinase PhoR [Zobellella denitrificans]